MDTQPPFTPYDEKEHCVTVGGVIHHVKTSAVDIVTRDVTGDRRITEYSYSIEGSGAGIGYRSHQEALEAAKKSLMG